MPPSAPLSVPVELRRGEGGPRCFRIARAISEEGLSFARPVPDDFEGPIDVALTLPEDEERVTLVGRIVEVPPETEDRPAERRAVRFVSPTEEARARIARYIQERLYLT